MMDAKQNDNLYTKWLAAENKIWYSDAVFGKIPDNVIRPGDYLYSFRMTSIGAYGMSGQIVDKTICSRCGRRGGRNAYAFGIAVTKINRIANECDDCGVSLDDLEALMAKEG